MRMSVPSQLCLLVILLFPIPSLAKGFLNYKEEVYLAKLILDCSSEKVIPAGKDFGEFYICALGETKTARWFISEEPITGMVQNIGLVWVEWQVDNGYGIRADQKAAERALDFLIGLYVSAKRNDIRMAFWDSKNKEISTSDFMIYYTFKPGSHKNERFIAIEEK